MTPFDEGADERESSLPPPEPSRESPTVRGGPARGPGEAVAAPGRAPAPVLLVDGRYRVRGELGRGGMGVVYLAKDTWLGRSVALKMLEPTWSKDSRAAASFLREAKALAAIRNANVVQVYAFGLHEESYFFAMEYVRGRTLSTILAAQRAQGAPLALRAALAILDPIARGMGALHDAGIVHRDVKPANIIVEEGSGRPVLVDLGLAAADHEGASRIHIVGTPRYMAPEQAAGGGLITTQSDAYALGCTAFEVLTGQGPFDAADPDELRWAHLYCVPRAVSSLCPALVPFDAVLARALAKSPGDRFAGCAAFADAMAAAARQVWRGEEDGEEGKAAGLVENRRSSA